MADDVEVSSFAITVIIPDRPELAALIEAAAGHAAVLWAGNRGLG